MLGQSYLFYWFYRSYSYIQVAHKNVPNFGVELQNT